MQCAKRNFSQEEKPYTSVLLTAYLKQIAADLRQLLKRPVKTFFFLDFWSANSQRVH